MEKLYHAAHVSLPVVKRVALLNEASGWLPAPDFACQHGMTAALMQ